MLKTKLSIAAENAMTFEVAYYLRMLMLAQPASCLVLPNIAQPAGAATSSLLF